MSRLETIAIWVGGIALLAATLADVVAVIGRNIGLPLHGSIELVQVAVLGAGAIALVLATVAGNHAKVHLLYDRLSGGWKDTLGRLNSAVEGLFYALVLAGSAWLAMDLWFGHEVSEVRGIGWRWMRLFANGCFAAIIIVTFTKTFGRRRG